MRRAEHGEPAEHRSGRTEACEDVRRVNCQLAELAPPSTKKRSNQTGVYIGVNVAVAAVTVIAAAGTFSCNREDKATRASTVLATTTAPATNGGKVNNNKSAVSLSTITTDHDVSVSRLLQQRRPRVDNFFLSKTSTS